MKKSKDPGSDKYKIFILVGGIGALISTIVLALLYFGMKAPKENDSQDDSDEPETNEDPKTD